MRPAGAEADHQRLLVDPAEAAERLLRRARHDLGAEVEQHEQVAQVGGEERHLVGARDEQLLGAATIASIAGLDRRERETLRAVSSTLTWSAASAVSNSFWSSENSGSRAAGAPVGRPGA